MKNSLTLVLATLVALIAAPSYGTVVHDEASSGDFSGLFGTPTLLVFANGANTIVGQIGINGNSGATDGSDADYFSFVVPPDASISSITIDSHTFDPSLTDPARSFLAYVAGSEFSGQEFEDIDGLVLFTGLSGDILTPDTFGNSLAGGSSLGAGTYSFWIQETANAIVDYQIIFTQVPEPSAGVLLTMGLLGLFTRRGSLRRCIAGRV